MEDRNMGTEAAGAEVIGGEFKNYAEYKQEFDRIIHRTAEGFVEIGYMLRIADDTNLIREAGYKNMEEFAGAEYGIDKSQASRFININKAFSEGGYSRVLQTGYQGMGVAKLGLMLTLPMAVNEELTPDFSKEEIRTIKEEVDEEKKITELEVWLEGEKETQAGLSTMLEKAVHQLGEEDPELFLTLWRYTIEAVQSGEREGLLHRLSEELAPSGDAVHSVRVQGTGRLMFSFKEREESFKLINIRQDEKEAHSLLDILDILWRLSGGKPYAGKEAWAAVYGRDFPEEKREEPEKKAAPKKKSRVARAETKTADGSGEQPDGQTTIEDFPEYLPEGYEKEKVVPVQQEEETEKEQENVIKTGPEAEGGIREEDSRQQAPSVEEDTVTEDTAAEKAPEESREAAVLEGMGLPEPEWVKTREPSREDAVSGIRQLAIDIADTVIENAFHVDTGRMRQLELAKEDAGRLQEMIGGLIEMIKKEAYQE